MYAAVKPLHYTLKSELKKKLLRKFLSSDSRHIKAIMNKKCFLLQ